MTMNSCIKPFVDDLLVLWEGILPIVVRGALLAKKCESCGRGGVFKIKFPCLSFGEIFRL